MSNGAQFVHVARLHPWMCLDSELGSTLVAWFGLSLTRCSCGLRGLGWWVLFSPVQPEPVWRAGTLTGHGGLGGESATWSLGGVDGSGKTLSFGSGLETSRRLRLKCGPVSTRRGAPIVWIIETKVDFFSFSSFFGS